MAGTHLLTFLIALVAQNTTLTSSSASAPTAYTRCGCGSRGRAPAVGRRTPTASTTTPTASVETKDDYDDYKEGPDFCELELVKGPNEGQA